MRIQSILKAGIRTASLVIIASIASIPAQADTFGFTLSFAGDTPTMPPYVVGTTLFLDGISTGGSLYTGYPALDTLWNPVTWHDTCQADLLTGNLTGIFTMTFANSDTLTGTLAEDVSAVIPTGMGPFTGALTFTGGTGEFAGATGSASVAGIVALDGSITGSGTLTAPRVSAVPEPASVALMFEGLLAMAAARRLVRRRHK